VHHVDAQAAKARLFGEEVEGAVLLGDGGVGELGLQEGRHLFLQLGLRAGKLQLFYVGERLLEALVEHQNRLEDGLPDPRQALDRAADQVQGQKVQEQDEPPGVVHIEEAKGGVEADLGFAQGCQVFARGALHDDRPDDRGTSKPDEEKDAKFQGAEEIPHLIGKTVFIRSQGSLPKRL